MLSLIWTKTRNFEIEQFGPENSLASRGGDLSAARHFPSGRKFVGASQPQVSRLLAGNLTRPSRLFEEMCLYAARLDGGVSVEAVRGLTVERSGGRMSFKSANAYWSLEQKSFR